MNTSHYSVPCINERTDCFFLASRALRRDDAFALLRCNVEMAMTEHIIICEECARGARFLVDGGLART